MNFLITRLFLDFSKYFPWFLWLAVWSRMLTVVFGACCFWVFLQPLAFSVREALAFLASFLRERGIVCSFHFLSVVLSQIPDCIFSQLASVKLEWTKNAPYRALLGLSEFLVRVNKYYLSNDFVKLPFLISLTKVPVRCNPRTSKSHILNLGFRLILISISSSVGSLNFSWPARNQKTFRKLEGKLKFLALYGMKFRD